MRLPLLALLALFVAGVAHAQLSFGPSGVSSPPINLVTAYKFVRDLWATITRTGGKTESVKVASKLKAETRQAGGSETTKDYDKDLQDLKSRIQAASEAAAQEERTDEKINTESPLTRAILLPKKKIVIGKWPIVYGVLNGLLLAAAIILAKPYFYTGDTVISRYEKNKEDQKKQESYGDYSDEMVYTMAVPMAPPAAQQPYGMPATAMTYGTPTLAQGQLSPMYSTHMMVVRDDAKKKPKTKYKLKGTSSEIGTVSVLPPPPPSRQQRPSYGQAAPANSREDSKENNDEVPLNELHYYNPTVFVSKEPSSYACLERMVCMNPSRSAQAQELSSATVAEARSLSGEGGPSPAELNFMRRRLDQAAALGSSHGDCSQYFCPPQLPTLNQEQVGDHYSPPPASNRFSNPANQFSLGNQISPPLGANHFSLGPGNLNTQSSNEAPSALYSSINPHSQGSVGDGSGSKEAKGHALSIQKLRPIYQNEDVQGFGPSIVTSQNVVRGRLVPGKTYGNSIHRTQKVEDDVSEEEASTAAPPPKETTSIRWIQAPRIHSINYPKVAVQNTESEEEAAYRQHPRNFMRRTSEPVASVVVVPVPGRENVHPENKPTQTGKS